MLTRLMKASSAYQGDYAAILQGYAISSQQVTNDEIFLAEDDGGLLGFYSLTNLTAEAERDLLFVSDRAQGKGIGTTLFQHIQALAHRLGIKSIKIVAHPSAEPFYLRMGASRVGLKTPSGRVTWPRLVLVLSVQPFS